jgi:hypothetical protein
MQTDSTKASLPRPVPGGALKAHTPEMTHLRCTSARQVYDLTQHNPEPVLRALHERLIELCRRAHPAAEVVAKSLVVLVAGGDGSLSWVLKAVRRLAHAANVLAGSRCGLGARWAWIHR